LVEIIPAVQTNENLSAELKQLMLDWKKVPVLAKDTPGFIVNRVARPFYGESLRICEEGIASKETIDWALKEIGCFKMGPFELMDLIGNDINYTVTETVWTQSYFDPRYKPSIIQKKMVESKRFGRKSGIGYYDYHEGAVNDKADLNYELANLIFDRVIVMLINEAADAFYYQIASENDIDLAMTKGVNYPKGLLLWANELGILNVVNKIDKLYNTYHDDRYRTSVLLRKFANENKLFFS
jgi:3-hydroxybutyryl-CoA dehydrogenase